MNIKRLVVILLVLAALSAGMFFMLHQKTSVKLTADQLFTQAKQAQDEKRVQDAIEKYEAILQEYPNSPLVADALFFSGGNHITLSVMKDPSYKKRELDLALLAFSKLIKDYPLSSKKGLAIFMTGSIYQELKQDKKAAAVYEEAIAKYSDLQDLPWDRVFWFLGEYYNNQNDPQRSLYFFSRMVQKYPDAPDANLARLAMVDAAVKVGNFDLAKVILEDVAKRKPGPDVITPDELQFKLAVLPQYQGQADETVDKLKDFLKKFPSSPLATQANYQIASILIKEEKWDDADKYFYDILGKEPNSIGALTGLAYIRVMKNKELGLAESLAGKAVDQDPKSGFPHMILGMVKYRQEKYADAADELETSLKAGMPTQENQMMAFYFLGLTNAAQEDTEEATKNFRQVIAINGKHHLADLAKQQLKMLVTKQMQ